MAAPAQARPRSEPPRSLAEIRRLMGFSRERLAQIAEIAHLGRMIYTPEGFDLFLTTPMGVFAGLTALQFIEMGRDDEVFAALAADYEGIGF